LSPLSPLTPQPLKASAQSRIQTTNIGRFMNGTQWTGER
jgi:hypothetical protein